MRSLTLLLYLRVSDMPSPPPLVPGVVYHLFNRGTNREVICRTPENYRHLLRLYAHHVAPEVDTFAFCLLPNHFHLLVRARSAQASAALSRCFNAYAKAFNRRYARTGSLFEHPFRRKPVDDDRYFATLVRYVHHNPQRHGLIEDFRAWPYSSWPLVTGTRPTRLDRATVLEWCGGPDNLVAFHADAPALPERLTDNAFEAAVERDLNPLREDRPGRLDLKGLGDL